MMSDKELIKVDNSWNEETLKDKNVIYQNDLKSINLTKLTNWEFKIWMYLLYSVKNKQEQEIVLYFDETFRDKLGITKNNNEIFEILKSVTRKLITQYIVVTNKEETKEVIFNFFNKFEIDKNKGTLTAKVNKEFLYIVNYIVGNYSLLKYNELEKINSKYALQLYKFVREFYNQERIIWTYDTFKKNLGIENKDTNYINKKVLAPIFKELSAIFQDFKIEKEYSKRRGRKVEKIIFTWTKQEQEIKNNIANDPFDLLGSYQNSKQKKQNNDFTISKTQNQNLQTENKKSYIDWDTFTKLQEQKEKENPKNDSVVSQNEDEMFLEKFIRKYKK